MDCGGDALGTGDGGTEGSKRPTPDGFSSWTAYWTAQGMPWRTEPEVDAKRRVYLTERRAVRPDIERGIYPFHDEHGPISLTRADIEWLLATHERDLSVPPEWDVWRAHERVGLDLRGVDLRHADLHGLPLTNVRAATTEKGWWRRTTEQVAAAVAHFEGATLEAADLRGGNLTRACLDGANLRHASLHQASLVWASLVRADLSHVQMVGTSLSAADLHHAQLVSAQLDTVVLDGALLDDADMEGSHWRHVAAMQTSLERTRLRRAVIEDTHFPAAVLRGADLRGAVLRQVSFACCDLRTANLSGVQAHDCLFEEVSFEGADLRGADLSGTELRDADLTGAQLDGAKLDTTGRTDAPGG